MIDDCRGGHREHDLGLLCFWGFGNAYWLFELLDIPSRGDFILPGGDHASVPCMNASLWALHSYLAYPPNASFSKVTSHLQHDIEKYPNNADMSLFRPRAGYSKGKGR